MLIAYLHVNNSAIYVGKIAIPLHVVHWL
jgi:hypothetical protein